MTCGDNIIIYIYIVLCFSASNKLVTIIQLYSIILYNERRF